MSGSTGPAPDPPATTPATPAGTSSANAVGGTRYYYLTDGLGSTDALINDNGATVHNTYTYDAWGNITATTGTTANPWKYASGYQDPTGLTKFGARYYDPGTGRWTQPDPLGGTISNPGEVNRYPYVGSCPSNYTDPTGKSVFSAAKRFLGKCGRGLRKIAVPAAAGVIGFGGPWELAEAGEVVAGEAAIGGTAAFAGLAVLGTLAVTGCVVGHRG